MNTQMQFLQQRMKDLQNSGENNPSWISTSSKIDFSHQDIVGECI